MNTVIFRDFEERDIDFIYRCKNDEKLNSMVVGEWHPFTYEEAVKWVHGCMGEHETYKFWAVATNDAEKRIVGWVSLSQIDKLNESACFHGIVIADNNFMDGFAWLEYYLFIMKYVFEELGLNRLHGSSILGHGVSNSAGEIFLWTQEGILRKAEKKKDIFYDIKISSILKEEYFRNKQNGEYEFKSILKRIKQIKKHNN